MLILRTGLPGSGKTLNTIREIESEHAPDPKQPNKPDRTVYYHGIPDLDTSKLKCRWIEFDTPDQWYELPEGSIIVIDEAQKVFGAQDGRKARPEKVARFETHRHQGFDIFLITQHPLLIMTHVRKLVGKHVNMYRPYGGSRLIRHEYEFCVDAPEKRANFKLAQESRIKLDPKYFGVYRSATVHTHKFKLPNYVWLIPAMLLLVLGCAGYLVRVYLYPDKPAPVAAASGAQVAQAKPVAHEGKPVESRGLLGSGLGAAQAPMTPDEYRKSLEPRIAGFPHTAPRYDRLTEPKSFPKPTCAASFDAGVVARGRKHGRRVSAVDGQPYVCSCLSQQGTRMDMPAEVCLGIVQNGFFDDTRPDDATGAAASMFGAPGQDQSKPVAQAVAVAKLSGKSPAAPAPAQSAAQAAPAGDAQQPAAEYVPAIFVGGISAQATR